MIQLPIDILCISRYMAHGAICFKIHFFGNKRTFKMETIKLRAGNT